MAGPHQPSGLPDADLPRQNRKQELTGKEVAKIVKKSRPVLEKEAKQY